MRRLVPALVVLAACGDPAAPAPPLPPAPPPLPAPPGLEVVGSTPGDGAIGVARAAFVTLVFSAPVDPLTVDEATVGLWQDAIPVPASLRTVGARIELVPRDLLELNTTYIVTARREVHDTAGRPMLREFRLTFTTKANRVP